MKATSQVKIDHRKIAQLTSAAVVSLEQTAEALHTEVIQAQVVPRDTGNLQNEAFFVDYTQCKDGIATLGHTTPYARRLYFHPEYNFQTDENPNAKGKWFEDWQAGGKYENFCEKTFAKLYRRNAGL